MCTVYLCVDTMPLVRVLAGMVTEEHQLLGCSLGSATVAGSYAG